MQLIYSFRLWPHPASPYIRISTLSNWSTGRSTPIHTAIWLSFWWSDSHFHGLKVEILRWYQCLILSLTCVHVPKCNRNILYQVVHFGFTSSSSSSIIQYIKFMNGNYLLSLNKGVLTEIKYLPPLIVTECPECLKNRRDCPRHKCHKTIL